MKKFGISIIVSLLLLMGSGIVFAVDDWQVVGISDANDGQSFNTFVVDSVGSLYSVFTDNHLGWASSVKKFAPLGDWSFVGDQGFSSSIVAGGYSYYHDMIVDNSGNMYVAWSNSPSFTMQVARRLVGGSWELIGSNLYSGKTNNSANRTINNSLVINAAGELRVVGGIGVEFPSLEFERVQVWLYSGSSWSVEWSTGFAAGEGGTLRNSTYVDAILGPDDREYFAYEDYNNGRKATVVVHSGGTYEVLGGVGLSNGATVCHNMAFDSNGQLYIVYIDESYGKKAVVKTYVGASRQTVGSAGFSSGEISSLYDGYTRGNNATELIDIVLDNEDNIYVAYGYTLGAVTQLVVQQYIGGSWQDIGGVGLSGDAAYEVSLGAYASGLFLSYNKLGGGDYHITKVFGEVLDPDVDAISESGIIPDSRVVSSSILISGTQDTFIDSYSRDNIIQSSVGNIEFSVNNSSWSNGPVWANDGDVLKVKFMSHPDDFGITGVNFNLWGESYTFNAKSAASCFNETDFFHLGSGSLGNIFCWQDKNHDLTDMGGSTKSIESLEVGVPFKLDIKYKNITEGSLTAKTIDLLGEWDTLNTESLDTGSININVKAFKLDAFKDIIQ